MEYVAGKTLAERIHEQGRLGVDDARSVVGQVAAALAAAHAASSAQAVRSLSGRGRLAGCWSSMRASSGCSAPAC